MSNEHPTRDFTVNDIVYHVGVLAGKVEGNGKEIGLLRKQIEKLHCLKEAEIAALTAAAKDNSQNIAKITQRIDGAANFASGGIKVGRWFVLAIIWLILTGIPGAFYTYKIVKSTFAAPVQTQVTP